jgi:hypothetical protein
MRVIAFIIDPTVIRKILQHRSRPEPRAHNIPWQRPPEASAVGRAAG